MLIAVVRVPRSSSLTDPPSLSRVMSAAMTATSPSPLAASVSPGLGMTIEGRSNQRRSPQLGPCNPASASTASAASAGLQPAIWSPCTAGAISASSSTKSAPSEEISLWKQPGTGIETLSVIAE